VGAFERARLPAGKASAGSSSHRRGGDGYYINVIGWVVYYASARSPAP
jgi:hypothetical protein